MKINIELFETGERDPWLEKVDIEEYITKSVSSEVLYLDKINDIMIDLGKGFLSSKWCLWIRARGEVRFWILNSKLEALIKARELVKK